MAFVWLAWEVGSDSLHFLWSNPTNPTGVFLRAGNDAVHQSACVKEEKCECVYRLTPMFEVALCFEVILEGLRAPG